MALDHLGDGGVEKVGEAKADEGKKTERQTEGRERKRRTWTSSGCGFQKLSSTWFTAGWYLSGFAVKFLTLCVRACVWRRQHRPSMTRERVLTVRC